MSCRSGSELLRLEMALTALLRAEDLDVWIPGTQTTDQSAAAPSHLVVPLMITPILQISHPRFPEWPARGRGPGRTSRKSRCLLSAFALTVPRAWRHVYHWILRATLWTKCQSYFPLIFIGVLLLYSVVLVSAVQQRESKSAALMPISQVRKQAQLSPPRQW